ncbi:MAG TPA: hypothetical protein VNS32_29180 [Flavisolibacter sp.]|nr:hypothetical protein [Flavisolibacter sp.]
MAEIRKILFKIILQVVDILCHCLDIMRRITLPGKKRKGNLLSSLFLLYVGIIESLDKFEHRSFRLSVFFRKKYVCLGLMLVASLLLVLSTFESGTTPGIVLKTDSYPKQVALMNQTVECQKTQRSDIKINTSIAPFYPDQCISFLSSPEHSYPVKLYLFQRNFRI